MVERMKRITAFLQMIAHTMVGPVSRAIFPRLSEAGGGEIKK